MVVNREFWNGKRVFLTGHTGFKGGWLALWLADMGAEVYGFALPAPTTPSFSLVCGSDTYIRKSVMGDIRDASALQTAMQEANPDLVLHLAAQSLVRYSYKEPVETFEVNVLGTVHLLEAARQTKSVKSVTIITTDKCYKNNEWEWPYRENEAMGGHDPYSSSKGCAELVTAAYRNSFFNEQCVRVGSARAGNVIGGGDWAEDRLVPDFLRAIDNEQTLIIRSPHATRPWQHVLEPLSGYLALAEQLYSTAIGEVDEAWNFGPNEIDAQPVSWIVEELCQLMPGTRWECDRSPQPHEANYLKLDSSKAKSRLKWYPRWDLKTALTKTVEWHQAWRNGVDMQSVSLEQIHEYEGAIIHA